MLQMLPKQQKQILLYINKWHQFIEGYYILLKGNFINLFLLCSMKRSKDKLKLLISPLLCCIVNLNLNLVLIAFFFKILIFLIYYKLFIIIKLYSLFDLRKN